MKCNYMISLLVSKGAVGISNVDIANQSRKQLEKERRLKAEGNITVRTDVAIATEATHKQWQSVQMTYNLQIRALESKFKMLSKMKDAFGADDYNERCKKIFDEQTSLMEAFDASKESQITNQVPSRSKPPLPIQPNVKKIKVEPLPQRSLFHGTVLATPEFISKEKNNLSNSTQITSTNDESIEYSTNDEKGDY